MTGEGAGGAWNGNHQERVAEKNAAQSDDQCGGVTAKAGRLHGAPASRQIGQGSGPAVGGADFEHDIENVVPSFHLLQSGIGEHAAIPANVIDAT